MMMMYFLITYMQENPYHVTLLMPCRCRGPCQSLPGSHSLSLLAVVDIGLITGYKRGTVNSATGSLVQCRSNVENSTLLHDA